MTAPITMEQVIAASRALDSMQMIPLKVEDMKTLRKFREIYKKMRLPHRWEINDRYFWAHVYPDELVPIVANTR